MLIGAVYAVGHENGIATFPDNVNAFVKKFHGLRQLHNHAYMSYNKAGMNQKEANKMCNQAIFYLGQQIGHITRISEERRNLSTNILDNIQPEDE